MLRKLQHDFVASNLSSVSNILSHAPTRSLTRISLEARRDELAAEMREIQESPETHAATALFFSGKPVLGSRGIESEFAAKALGTYQDIVTKLFALRSKGQLGERGVVADRDLSRLHVTSLVRGSFGFLLEDVDENDLETAPVLKSAVDDSARLIGSFAEEDEEHFESAIAEIDNRVLQTVKSFFDILAKDSATLRVVASDSERTFDMNGILRAAERAKATEVEEFLETIGGTLQGVMPEKHEFELRTQGRTISGKVAGSISASELASLFNREVIADVTRTAVSRGGRVAKEKYFLTALREAEQKQRSHS